MNNSTVFSIIIPHKNTPNLLSHCLKSIPRAENIQVIIVDDNSNGSIVDFEWMLGLKGENVEVYLTKDGKGAGYARNVGMKYAKGKWIVFADSDDFFVENAFEHLFAHVNDIEDIVYFKAASIYIDTRETASREQKFNKLVDDYLKKEKYSEDRLRYLFNSPCMKMIKKEIIDRNHILFDEVPIADDLFFSCLAGHYASSIRAVDTVIYMITVRFGSLTNIRSFKMYKIMWTIFHKRNMFLKKIGKKHIQPSLLKRLFHTTFGAEKIKRKNYRVKKYVGT